MKELIFIGGYGQSTEMNRELVCELEKRGYSVESYTLAQFYKVKDKQAVLKDKTVATHSIGLWLITGKIKATKLLSFNPPEASGLFASFRQVLFSENFPKEHSLARHTKEVMSNPIVHVKSWFALKKFSATDRLIDIGSKSPATKITLYYSSGDRIARSSNHNFDKLKKNDIKTIDIKGLHRSLHSDPDETLKRAGI